MLAYQISSFLRNLLLAKLDSGKHVCGGDIKELTLSVIDFKIIRILPLIILPDIVQSLLEQQPITEPEMNTKIQVRLI